MPEKSGKMVEILMPYIDPITRHILDHGDRNPMSAGELNYELTKVIIDYITTKGESYQTYNDIIGALEGAKLELYRRKISPYEDLKIKDNGDVYNV